MQYITILNYETRSILIFEYKPEYGEDFRDIIDCIDCIELEKEETFGLSENNCQWMITKGLNLKMKEYTFRITQSLEGFYEGEVSIKAKSEEEARRKLKKLDKDKLENRVKNWKQAVEYAEGVGEIEIHKCINEK